VAPVGLEEPPYAAFFDVFCTRTFMGKGKEHFLKCELVAAQIHWERRAHYLPTGSRALASA